MKKIFLAIIFFIGIISTNASSDILYDAEEIPDVYIRKISGDGTEKVKQAGFIRRKSDNLFVYCVDPFASLKNNYSYYSYDEDYYMHLGISEETWNKISLIAYYGYQYGNHLEDYWYYITQVMIWREVDKEASFYFTETLGSQNDLNIFTKEINEIETLVANHLKLPEFDIEDINFGDTKIFNDKNGVLENYIIESGSATISENNLIISGNVLGKNTINLKRISNNYANVPIVYIDDTAQNVIAVGNPLDIEINIDYNVVENKIKVIKTNEENKLLAGVTFALYDENNSLIDIEITNEYGEALFSNLKVGKYKLKELATLENYILDEKEYEIELSGGLEEITISNKYKKGNLKILKVNEENHPISKTEFTLYNSNNEIIGKYITDNEGIIEVNNLKIGKYILKETKSNPKYYLLEELIEFEITEDEELITVQVTNELINIDIPNTNIDFDIDLYLLPNKKNKIVNN